MLSYANGAAERPLLGETIGHNLERTIARVPDAEALVSCQQGLRYTYAEFNAAVDAAACGMLAAGLGHGDRAGIWSPNRAEWALVQYATAKLGVILVNLNPSYRTSELAYAIKQSGCRWLFAAPDYRGSSFVEMVGDVRPGLPDLERVLFFGSDEWDELAAARSTPMRCGRGWTSSTSTTRSTSSTRAAPRASPRARRSPTTTSSTTAASSPGCSTSPRPTASASRSRSTTASAW